jgi:dephospho-CoA kinase
MPFIGLTGGLGTGKTTVLNFFKSFGARTISADTIVHDLLKRPGIKKKLASCLGKDILIKSASRSYINKKLMAETIFNDTRKRKATEKIIHPQVRKIALQKKKTMLQKNRKTIIVFEVPLLFEAGFQSIFDKVIVVYCRKDTALKRLALLGLSREQAIQRIKVQMPLTKKKAQADFLINNGADIRKTKGQVERVFKKLAP